MLRPVTERVWYDFAERPLTDSNSPAQFKPSVLWAAVPLVSWTLYLTQTLLGYSVYKSWIWLCILLASHLMHPPIIWKPNLLTAIRNIGFCTNPDRTDPDENNSTRNRFGRDFEPDLCPPCKTLNGRPAGCDFPGLTGTEIWGKNQFSVI